MAEVANLHSAIQPQPEANTPKRLDTNAFFGISLDKVFVDPKSI